MIRIEQAEARLYRYRLDQPVETSFGIMHDRPMLVIRLVSDEGIVGWGEVWCNFPTVGAEHRARLFDSVFLPMLTSACFADSEDGFDQLTKASWILGLQTGEPGPLAQIVAGIETALCDIDGQRAGLPIWKMLGGQKDSVPVYASGINPTRPEQIAATALEQGYRALKLKIGFGAERDLANLASLRQLAGPAIGLMADVNQGWTTEQALQNLDKLAEFDLGWLEEPIAADRPADEWQAIRQKAAMPIAAGENIQGMDNFQTVIEQGNLDVIQPDLAKWGGITKTVRLARKITDAGLLYCPHYLGGGIGLVASAHALAAAGGKGLLEVDVNPNPLRSSLCGNLLEISGGLVHLGSEPGLGFSPDLARMEQYRLV